MTVRTKPSAEWLENWQKTSLDHLVCSYAYPRLMPSVMEESYPRSFNSILMNALVIIKAKVKNTSLSP